jgi:hypothetical protein
MLTGVSVDYYALLRSHKQLEGKIPTHPSISRPYRLLDCPRGSSVATAASESVKSSNVLRMRPGPARDLEAIRS